MEAATVGAALPYILGALSLIGAIALTYYGAWIVAMVLTAVSGALAWYLLSQIDPDTRAPFVIGLAIIGMFFFFLAAGGALGTVIGFVLRYVRKR
ncbi:MAG: hypothetical protein ACRC6I_15650 [Paracoccaceae bacterium]